MPEVSSCPDVLTLQRLLVGLVSLEEAEALEEHIRLCERCLASLPHLEAADSLVERLRGGAAIAAEFAQGEVLDDLIRRLRAVPPPPGGAAAENVATPASEGPATVIGPHKSEDPGTVIGPYKLLDQLGEGGFGVVFLAEQQQPVRRKVALKVLKPGMDTRQVIVRFEAERQALALMDHPNIAHVFDGGETASGRPYFVMELVRGIPITEFCDQNHLPIRQRLELFVNVCQAVQHAHQKGVIHRDLKPSNLLVTLHDGTPVVKVIDFGIAKAMGHHLTDKTLFTSFVQMIGTPLYMSPEQAGLSGLDTDTRSDIYALGVLLYELLTGTTPLHRQRFQGAGYDEIRRIIREEEPPKPSTRLSTLAQVATTVSAQRRSDPNLKAWDLATSQGKDVLHTHHKGARCQAFSADGQTVATGGHDGTIKLWDVRTWQERATLPGHKDPVQCLEFSSDSRKLASASAWGPDGGEVKIWDLARRPAPVAVRLPRSGAYGVAFSPDGQKLATSGNDKEAAPGLYEVATGRHCASFQGHIGPAYAVAFASDGKTLASGGSDRTVRLWDANTGQQRTCYADAGPVHAVRFSPDGKLLASAGSGAAITLRDVARARDELVLPGAGAFVAFSPDGAVLATGSQFGVLKLLDAATGKERAALQPSDRGMNWIFCVAFSPDGKLLASGDRPGSAKLWDVAAGKVRLALKGHTDSVFALAFTPDGRTLATGGDDKTVKLWDVVTGQERMTLKGFKDAVRSLAFSPDGTLLAAGSWDDTVRVWRAATDAEARARRPGD